MYTKLNKSFNRLITIPEFLVLMEEFRHRLDIPATGFNDIDSDEYKSWILQAAKKRDFIRETFLFIAKRCQALNIHDDPIPFTILAYYFLFNKAPLKEELGANKPLFSINPSGILGYFDIVFTLPLGFSIEQFIQEVEKHKDEIELISENSIVAISNLENTEDASDEDSITRDFLLTTPGNGSDTVDRVHRDLNYLVELGRVGLREHLSTMKETDFEIHSYADKNKPMLQTIQQMGSFLFNRHLFSIAEAYWEQIDTEVVDFNKSTGKRVNRGIPLANQGVAQIAQGKVIEGLFNIYKAHEDDRVCLQHLTGISIDPEKDMGKSILYTQFEELQISNLFNIIVSKYGSVFNNPVTKSDLLTFVSNLAADKKLLFYIILYRFSFAFALNSELTNLISRSEILRSLAEFALWFEDELKQKDTSLVGLTLIKILDRKMRAPLNPTSGEYTNATTLTELSTKISNAVSTTSNLEMTNARVTGCLRNFAGHNLEVQDHAFFQSCDEVFARMLSFVLFSKSSGWI